MPVFIKYSCYSSLVIFSDSISVTFFYLKDIFKIKWLFIIVCFCFSKQYTHKILGSLIKA